jgi:hypothetical protein
MTQFWMIIAMILLISDSIGQNHIETSNSNSFELVVGIEGLVYDNIGCGTVVYTICLTGEVYSHSVIGKEVLLYITCPEILNSLPFSDKYRVSVEFYSERTSDGIIYSCFETETKMAKLRVLDIRPSPR